MDKRIVSRKHKIVGTVIKVNGRTVGQVIGADYVKDITNRHMLTTPPAIANDIQALHDAERAGALYCVFTNIDSGVVYRAAIAKIWDMGKQIDFGYGPQQMLNVQNWTQTLDPEYASHTDADPQAYGDADSSHAEVKPLKYKSNAPKGVTFTKGVKQLPLWGRR